MQVILHYLDGESLTFVRIDKVSWESKKGNIVRIHWTNDDEEQKSFTVPGVKKWETKEDDKHDAEKRLSEQ